MNLLIMDLELYFKNSVIPDDFINSPVFQEN